MISYRVRKDSWLNIEGKGVQGVDPEGFKNLNIELL